MHKWRSVSRHRIFSIVVLPMSLTKMNWVVSSCVMFVSPLRADLELGYRVPIQYGIWEIGKACRDIGLRPMRISVDNAFVYNEYHAWDLCSSILCLQLVLVGDSPFLRCLNLEKLFCGPSPTLSSVSSGALLVPGLNRFLLLLPPDKKVGWR